MTSSGDISRLRSRYLPCCNSAEEIALEMGISVGKLRFLTLQHPQSIDTHYTHFVKPKSNGGNRIISVPIPSLKAAQTWIFRSILARVEVHGAAHGFRRNRSIVTNARPHVGQDLVIKLDLQDFFGSIDDRRVKSVFSDLGYGETAANIFRLLCTARSVKQAGIDREIRYTKSRKRCLPQGAVTSPALSNIFCFTLDRELSQLSKTLNFTYTRYADDLTFSGDRIAATNSDRLFGGLEQIVDREGFKINPDKTQILGKGQQQQVTGIVVNQKLNISKHQLDIFRATLYQIECDGWAGKSWGNSPDLLAAITGYANYVAMVNPSKGQQLLNSIERIFQKHPIG